MRVFTCVILTMTSLSVSANAQSSQPPAPVRTDGFDLTGAWASSLEHCGKVFKKTKNQITFAQDSEVYGSGFIASAKQLRGRAARCTITSKKQTGDTLHLLTSCSTDIMLQNVQFSVKILDDNKISRLFPGMEGMEISYYRCDV